jgi:uncharacterized protein YraI
MKRSTWSAHASLRLATFVLAFSACALPALAQAADGYVTGNVNLRAGPDPSYPLIDRIPAGTDVSVQGCTDGWEWCDVIVYGNRGWVAGNYIQYDYQDRRVLLPAYGAQTGIPIITFVIVNYWDQYYRSRPFYRERSRWYRRPIVRRPPPPPLRHPYAGGPRHGTSGQRPSWNQRTPVRAQPRLQEPNTTRPPSNRPAPPRDNNPSSRPSARQSPAPERLGPAPARVAPANRPPSRGTAAGNRSDKQQPVTAHDQSAGRGRHESKPAEHKKDHDDNGGH